MRIVAGRFRGRRLAALGKGDSAAHLRPTTDRVRESLFSMLTHQDAIEGEHTLDLFAGSGALGLEALSRGATHVTFVENGRKGSSLIRENILILDVERETSILPKDARRLPKNAGPACGLVFLDPPYGKGLGEIALAQAVAGGWISDRATIVWEESAQMPSPPGFEQLDVRRYGDSWITILRREA